MTLPQLLLWLMLTGITISLPDFNPHTQQPAAQHSITKIVVSIITFREPDQNKPSPTPVKRAETGSNPSAAGTTTTTDPLTAINECYKSNPCIEHFSLVQECFFQIGGITDPNSNTTNHGFQSRFCDTQSHLPHNYDHYLSECITCFIQNGMNIDRAKGFGRLFTSLCGSAKPSVWLMLRDMFAFLKEMRAPSLPSWTVLRKGVYDVTTLAPLFRSEPGLNSVDPTREMPKTTATSNPPQTPKATGNPSSTVAKPFPTSRLMQLPPHWPYHRYAKGRKNKDRTTWTLTDDEGDAMAKVVATWQWYPRWFGSRAPKQRYKGSGDPVDIMLQHPHLNVSSSASSSMVGGSGSGNGSAKPSSENGNGGGGKGTSKKSEIKLTLTPIKPSKGSASASGSANSSKGKESENVKTTTTSQGKGGEEGKTTTKGGEEGKSTSKGNEDNKSTTKKEDKTEKEGNQRGPLST